MNSITPHLRSATPNPSPPIHPLPRLTGQLDYEVVLSDWDIEPSLWNISVVARAKEMPVASYGDGSHTVPTHPEAKTLERVSVGRVGVYCSCAEWYSYHCVKHDYPMADPDWLCPHGAAVLMRLGGSQTYGDWLSHQSITKRDMLNTPEPELEPPDNGLNRRAFFACLGKRHALKLARVGLDRDMVAEAYRRRFSVSSLSQIGDRDWAIAAAEMQAATGDTAMLRARATELKGLLEARVTPMGGQAA